MNFYSSESHCGISKYGPNPSSNCLLNYTSDSFNSVFSLDSICPKFVTQTPRSTTTTVCEKPFQCRWIDCKSIGFDSQMSLVGHIERVHVESRREDFSCFWLGCPRRNRPFNARYKLLIHLRIHSGHKPNKCTFQDCTKAFSRLENLKIHLRSHTGERPYVCTNSFCMKSFSNSSDRAKHQRTHIDKKPYACTFHNCEKRYTDPSSLRKHAKIHNNPSSPILMNKSTGKSAFNQSLESSPSSTPSSVTSETTFEFPEILNHGPEYFESPNYSLDLFKPQDSASGNGNIKSEYFCPDLNYYYSDFDWMFYFELRDVETILGD